MLLRGLANQGERWETKMKGRAPNPVAEAGQQHCEERREYPFIHSSTLLKWTWENKGSLKLILS